VGEDSPKVEKKEEVEIGKLAIRSYLHRSFCVLLHFSSFQLIITMSHHFDSLGKGVAGQVSDPFSVESRDSRLFVADIPPGYSLLLNKYYSLDEHVSYAVYHPHCAAVILWMRRIECIKGSVGESTYKHSGTVPNSNHDIIPYVRRC
jgi:hypothetical protein